MPARRQRRVRPCAAALVVLSLAGCSTGERKAGEAITEDEAGVLAELLHRNHTDGGADFVVTVPFGEDAVLTLTGEIDFRRAEGRAEAVTVVDDDERDVRTLFFDRDELWIGDVPGLAESLAAVGQEEAAYLRRPLTGGSGDSELLDVLVRVLVNLSSRTADDPAAFRADPYRWQAARSVDGRPTQVYRLREGRTVSVDSGDGTLVQYQATLPQGDLDLTVTLAEHGPREVALPSEEETAAVADHPGIAADYGV